jgi:hypothetical protein
MPVSAMRTWHREQRGCSIAESANIVGVMWDLGMPHLFKVGTGADNKPEICSCQSFSTTSTNKEFSYCARSCAGCGYGPSRSLVRHVLSTAPADSRWGR